MKCSKCGCDFSESDRCNEDSRTCPDCDRKNIEWAHHWLREARAALQEKCKDCAVRRANDSCLHYCGTRNFLEEMDRVQIGFN